MNNREIVDYILSNKLTENDVIKRIERDELNTYVTYLHYDEIDLYDDNGQVSIFSFCDEKTNLAGNIRFSYTYEVISKEQAYKELEEKQKKEKIERLERELQKLKGE